MGYLNNLLVWNISKEPYYEMCGLSASLFISQLAFTLMILNSNLLIKLICAFVTALIFPITSQGFAQYVFDKGDGITFLGYYTLGYIFLFLQTILVWLSVNSFFGSDKKEVKQPNLWSKYEKQ